MYAMGDEEAEAVRRVIASRQLFRYRGGEGGAADQFEAEWAERTGVRYGLAVTSGSAALMCALAGMEVGPGDEVIVPGYTWIATALAPLAVGAIPIVAEVDESLTLDPKDVEQRITPRTKVICPVHMSGFPCNLQAICDVARGHGLRVLEDACQADGGSYKGKPLGSWGDAGGFSFNQFKIITCGEGGAMVTDDVEVYRRALMFHDLGTPFRAHAESIEIPVFAGLNFRMNEVLSAILRVQLTRLDGILEALRREKRILMSELDGVSAFRFNPVHDLEGDCATTLALLFDSKDEARAFLAAMKEEGVALGSPIDSGHHLYVNWKTILEKRGAHHPGRDPYKLCGYDVPYSKDMCPRTLEFLARTVYISTAVDRSDADLMALIKTVKKVAQTPVRAA